MVSVCNLGRRARAAGCVATTYGRDETVDVRPNLGVDDIFTAVWQVHGGRDDLCRQARGRRQQQQASCLDLKVVCASARKWKFGGDAPQPAETRSGAIR